MATSLGVARKDQTGNYCCSPCAPCGDDDPAKKKEWENTILFPELRVEGAQAEIIGADDLEVDDVVEVTVKLKVKSKCDDTKRIEGEAKPKRDISICFCVLETSDLTKSKDDSAPATEDDGMEMDMSDDSAPVRALVGAGKDSGY